jgi:hypothetical protein
MQETTGSVAVARLSVTTPRVNKRVTFQPFEIKTFRIEKSGRAKECRLVDEG